MDYFAGLDVSVKETSICIVDDTGKIVREARVASEPEALLQVLTNTIYRFKRVGLEAGPLSQWLYSDDPSLEVFEVAAALENRCNIGSSLSNRDAQSRTSLFRIAYRSGLTCKLATPASRKKREQRKPIGSVAASSLRSFSVREYCRAEQGLKFRRIEWLPLRLVLLKSHTREGVSPRNVIRDKTTLVVRPYQDGLHASNPLRDRAPESDFFG
jgi:hypothetical protein